MGVLQSPRRYVVVAALAGSTMVLGTPSAPAAPSDADLNIFVAVGTTIPPPVIANSGTAEIEGLSFKAGAWIDNNGGEEASARIRFTLPDGLRFGTDVPDPTESCVGTATTAECQTALLIATEPARRTEGWGWDVVADRAGSYLLRAEIIQTSVADPDLSSNTASATVVVTEPSLPPPPAPVLVSASATRLSPAKPKAGSLVTATVRVTAGGISLKPGNVRCSGTVGGVKLAGKPRAAAGKATCAYRPPKTAKGKTLRGAISFNARGKRFTKRFSAKLR